LALSDRSTVSDRPKRLPLPEARTALAFLPLLVVLGWWSRIDAVQMVASTLLPSLLAWHVLWQERGAAPLERRGKGVVPSVLGRDEFIARLDRFLAVRRRRGWATAAFCLGVVDYARLRRTHGSAHAEMLVAAAAERVRGLVRREDLVTLHEAGMILVALAPRPELDRGMAGAIAARLGKGFRAPLDVDGEKVHANVAVGYCLSAQAPADNARSLIEAAEIAMQEARAAQADEARHFTSRMQQRVRAREALAAELGEAFVRGEIVTHFQPQLSMDDGSVAGFEALVRWEHPEKGLLSPGAFLDLVHETGRSDRLARTVLAQALEAMRNWQRAGFDVPTVGINFSTEQLQDPRLLEHIKWEVDRHDLAPRRVAIEVLETVLCTTDDDILARNLRALREAGFTIDLDDFGTGHAAIANIRRFRVNRIKIDRGFIRGIDRDEGQRMLVEAMIRMAESLGVEALAEGVETPGEMSIVAQLGCRVVQGYAVARPMPFRETLRWLAGQAAEAKPPVIGRRSS